MNNETITKVWTSYAEHNLEPIYPNVVKYLGLNFGTSKFKFKSNIVEYIMCCKKYNINKLTLSDRGKTKRQVKCLRDIMVSSKYR